MLLFLKPISLLLYFKKGEEMEPDQETEMSMGDADKNANAPEVKKGEQMEAEGLQADQETEMLTGGAHKNAPEVSDIYVFVVLY